jgi:hypothetical protein
MTLMPVWIPSTGGGGRRGPFVIVGRPPLCRRRRPSIRGSLLPLLITITFRRWRILSPIAFPPAAAATLPSDRRGGFMMVVTVVGAIAAALWSPAIFHPVVAMGSRRRRRPSVTWWGDMRIGRGRGCVVAPVRRMRGSHRRRRWGMATPMMMGRIIIICCCCSLPRGARVYNKKDKFLLDENNKYENNKYRKVKRTVSKVQYVNHSTKQQENHPKREQ